ncbi:glycosyltransferase family 1 protein [Methylococcus sp. EFPC2]|uniref:glycosyltransferase family 4 protein n=1 Tax=Methylococcus sp. EFPC2 TaxID=2812648 RepID=UPI0019688BCC|nr:glycosyltransferase family 1 protein [Methylococcus sp. EFPC2]QSA98582.1 glycosyltransferase family 4 protein [Methylococcus sp. EFPC2]
MKILLIGNHPHDHSNSLSMGLFADCLHRGLLEQGHEVRLVRPRGRMWRTGRSGGWQGKWAKYVDQFILAQPELRRHETWADVVHVCDHSNAPFLSYLQGKPSVVTCHDTIGLKRALGHYREEKAGLLGRVLQAWTARNLRKASRIACVSNTVERELTSLLPLDPGRLSTVYNGLNQPYHPMGAAETEDTLRDLGIAPDLPLVLHVGSDEWKKNRRAVAEIFAELRRMDHPLAGQLVFVGAPLEEPLRRYLQQAGLQDAVSHRHHLSGSQLCALYSRAGLFLFPSLYEGFGWPIIEAQACGALVATSDRDPMREVAGAGAILIDPQDPVAAAERIAGKTESRLETLRLNGLANARRYTPEAMIKGYVALYEHTLDELCRMGVGASRNPSITVENDGLRYAAPILPVVRVRGHE